FPPTTGRRAMPSMVLLRASCFPSLMTRASTWFRRKTLSGWPWRVSKPNAIGSPPWAAGHFMKKLLILAAAVEGLTGLILLAYPPIAIRLLFGPEITGASVLISRLTGIALIALAVACWPDRNLFRAFFGMLTYNVLATLFLVYAGLIGA